MGCHIMDVFSTCLQNEAGPTIFLLFKAIKHQVEKGPVDAVTHEARYCLSEDRLLREQVPHSVLVSLPNS